MSESTNAIVVNNGVAQSALTIVNTADQRKLLQSAMRDFRADTIRVFAEASRNVFVTTEIFVSRDKNNSGIYVYSETPSSIGGTAHNVRIIQNLDQRKPDEMIMFRHTRYVYAEQRFSLGEILDTNVSKNAIVEQRETYYTAHNGNTNRVLKASGTAKERQYLPNPDFAPESAETATLYTMVQKFLRRVESGALPVNNRVSVFNDAVTLYGRRLIQIGRPDTALKLLAEKQAKELAEQAAQSPAPAPEQSPAPAPTPAKSKRTRK